jgi:hypothetical protein
MTMTCKVRSQFHYLENTAIDPLLEGGYDPIPYESPVEVPTRVWNVSIATILDSSAEQSLVEQQNDHRYSFVFFFSISRTEIDGRLSSNRRFDIPRSNSRWNGSVDTVSVSQIHSDTRRIQMKKYSACLDHLRPRW